MLLTKKSGASEAHARTPFVQSLQRGLSAALPTMDRRGFLRRSGLGVGVGLAAGQLALVKKARAAGSGPGIGDGKIEVKRAWSAADVGRVREVTSLEQAPDRDLFGGVLVVAVVPVLGVVVSPVVLVGDLLAGLVLAHRATLTTGG